MESSCRQSINGAVMLPVKWIRRENLCLLKQAAFTGTSLILHIFLTLRQRRSPISFMLHNECICLFSLSFTLSRLPSSLTTKNLTQYTGTNNPITFLLLMLCCSNTQMIFISDTTLKLLAAAIEYIDPTNRTKNVFPIYMPWAHKRLTAVNSGEIRTALSFVVPEVTYGHELNIPFRADMFCSKQWMLFEHGTSTSLGIIWLCVCVYEISMVQCSLNDYCELVSTWYFYVR